MPSAVPPLHRRVREWELKLLPSGTVWPTIRLALDEVGDSRNKLNDGWLGGTVNIDNLVHMNTMSVFTPNVKGESEKCLFGRVFRHADHTVHGMFGNDVSFDATAFDGQFTEVIGAGDVSQAKHGFDVHHHGIG